MSIAIPLPPLCLNSMSQVEFFTLNLLENYLNEESAKLIEKENSYMKPQTTVRQEFHIATTYTKRKTQLLVTNNFNLHLIQQNNAGCLLFCSSE